MKILSIATACVFWLAGPVQAATFTDVFTSFYSFGDSLTDDGKYSQLDKPSFEGRYTNGFVWAEYLEFQHLAAGHDAANLALGGATAVDVNQTSSGALSTFSRQVEAFADSLHSGINLPTRILPTLRSRNRETMPGDNPLLSVWFGANDLFQGVSPIAAADAVANGIRMLNAIDASVFDDFLVVALPNLGKVPALAGAEETGTTLTNAYNIRLAQNMQQLRLDGLNIIEYDPEGVLQRILDSVSSFSFEYGIFNASIPCTVSMGAALNPNLSNPYNCVDLGFDPDWLLFADGVHPNAVAHQLLAQDVVAGLNALPATTRVAAAAAVPLPAGLPLMLAGLLVLGVLFRRRAA